MFIYTCLDLFPVEENMLKTYIFHCREPGRAENIPYPDRGMASY